MGGLSDIFGDFVKTFTPASGDISDIVKASGPILTKRAQSEAKRAKDLFKAISDDETISDVTRSELLFGLTELDPEIFKAPLSGKDFSPDLPTQASFLPEGFGAADSLIASTPGRATLSQLESTFTKAKEGLDPKFASRQIRQKRQDVLKDQPGAKQFLIQAPKSGTLTPLQEDRSVLPTLTPTR